MLFAYSIHQPSACIRTVPRRTLARLRGVGWRRGTKWNSGQSEATISTPGKGLALLSSYVMFIFIIWPFIPGEHITETELIEYLMTLLGHSDNPEVDGSFSDEPLKALEELPSKITVSQYAEELLGLST